MTNKYRQDVPDGEFHARTQRMVGGQMFGFEWHGGAYIQVCRGSAFSHPGEVIHMWDDCADGPRYPRTDSGMAAAIDNWVDTYGADDLVHDMVNWS